MLIQDVINLAKNGELRNLALKDDVEAVLGYINLGMVEMYKRFPLNVDELIIPHVVGAPVYTMPDNYMWVVSAYGSIIKDNVIELSELAINEEDNEYSVNTVSWNQVQLSSGIATGDVSIVYVAAPTVYTEEDLGSHIGLPPQMIEPLLHFVGYRGHGSVDGNIQAEHNTHYQRFEASCKRIKMEGMLSTDDVSMSKRIVDRGFA